MDWESQLTSSLMDVRNDPKFVAANPQRITKYQHNQVVERRTEQHDDRITATRNYAEQSRYLDAVFLFVKACGTE